MQHFHCEDIVLTPSPSGGLTSVAAVVTVRDQNNAAVLNRPVRNAPGSIRRFSAISMNEYRNIIVPPVDAEMTSRVIGWDRPASRIRHPRPTIPHTSQK